MDIVKQTKIFISHSKADERIGEKLLDSFIDMGISKDIVFYSSKYHTGIGLGKDFHSEIKRALKECEIVVFLLTPNFYQSEFCLNEMGAVWISDKKFIPLLLGGLSYSEMKGFIDYHYIALTPDKSQSFKLYHELKKYISSETPVVNEKIFDSFLDEADKLSKDIPQTTTVPSLLSKTESMILSRKFTDQEIILLQFFIENETPILNDYLEYDYSTRKSIETEDLIAIKEYEENFSNFSYKKAVTLLEKSNYLTKNYQGDISGYTDYCGCELNIDLFRELISLSSQGQDYINSILNKHRKGYRKHNTDNLIANYILSSKLTENEALLFSYMRDTNDIALGDRWMATGTISEIEKWENAQKIKSHKLSQNYSSTLYAFVNKGFLEASSYTSYGNPRQYRLKQNYIDDLYALGYRANQVLATVVKNNMVDDDSLPF